MIKKRFEIFPQNVTKDGTLIIIQKGLKLYNISDVVELLNALYEENDKLKELIKENVFGMYEEGSLTDLEFKAIAYDDIVKLKISDESEPKVVVICKQGKKENVKSFCQMFIPFGIAYEIVEMIDDE